MVPEMTQSEVDRANATVAAPAKGNGQAATVDAKIDEFLAPVSTVLINGVTASLMAFFPVDRLAYRLAFLLGRSLGAGFQATDLPALLRYRAEVKRQFEAGLASVPANMAVIGGTRGGAHARPPNG